MTFGHNSWRCILPNKKNFPAFEVRQIHQKSQDGYENGKIPCKDPLPDLEECYALIRREAVRHASMKAESDNPDTSTMVDQSKTNHLKTDPNIDKSTFKCTHCNKTGHTKSRCFEIVGYPDWWDHNRDQGKKNSKKTLIAVVAEIKTEANVAEKLHWWPL
ncbi:hypothetical protein AAG906_017922 [Vitis piasezkii]